MIRSITGFHQDEAGDFVAELDCLHGQHLRHRPPFQLRAWVLDESERLGRLGSAIECPLCDQTEIPEGLEVLRVAGPFEQATLPQGLRRNHRVARCEWGRLQVAAGTVTFFFGGEPARVLSVDDVQAIPPGVTHHVECSPDARFTIEFLGRLRAPPSEAVGGPGDDALSEG